MTNTKQLKIKLHDYDVSVSRDTAEDINIRVRARNVEEAKVLAREEAENNFDLVWNPTDYIGDVQINNVDIVFPSRKKIGGGGMGTTETTERIYSSSDNEMTNIDVVTQIMEFSRFGVLAQAFVMDALVKVSRSVAEATAEEIEVMRGGFIQPEAWQGVAREIQEKLVRYSAK